ncbi:hypothetical protein [Actinomadura luteofluorescens]|uniref:hypothetical protein n=1 Tax=Actinomadura luteofluorescens TaxID=46163 RepID=UPI0030CCCB41
MPISAAIVNVACGCWKSRAGRTFGRYVQVVTAIWSTDQSGKWRLLTPSGYPAEAALHDLVEQSPQILPLAGSPRITVLGREVRLGGGYADLVAVEPSGQMVIVEVKLAGNSEARRAVVAQVLSYAAYLQGLDAGQLESQVLASHLNKRGFKTVVSAVEADDQEHSVDPQAFAEGLAQSLAEGNFRLVVVLDSVPDELAQIVGYLESVTQGIVIDLVTVSVYDVNGGQVLVPQRVEPARRDRELSTAEVTERQRAVLGSEEFRAVIADAPADKRELLERLTRWAEALQRDRLVDLSTYQGKAGITTLLPRLPGDAGLVTIYKDTKSVYLQFWRGVFERRAPHSIPLVETALQATLKRGNVTHEVSDDLLEALTNAYREAAG